MPGEGSIAWLSWAKYRKKLKLILQSNEMLSKKIVPLDAEGGVKVLSEKMGPLIIFKMTGRFQNRFIALWNSGT